jgi:hypothetical protein
MVLRVLSIVLGVTPATTCGLQRYYLESGELQWGAIKECKPGCQKDSYTGHGDSHYLPIGVDMRWKTVREAETR